MGISRVNGNTPFLTLAMRGRVCFLMISHGTNKFESVLNRSWAWSFIAALARWCLC